MWKEIVGKRYSVAEFDTYCRRVWWAVWQPKFCVLHNTAIPTLKQRPRGFTPAHMRSLERYYRDVQGWEAGPHLFIDDTGIWEFTPIVTPGVHSPSWNRVALGIEMLGDYETEDFSRGRGLKVQQNAVCAIASLCDVLKLQSNSLRLHREDPKTTHACPGKNVVKADFIRAVRNRILELREA